MQICEKKLAVMFDLWLCHILEFSCTNKLLGGLYYMNSNVWAKTTLSSYPYLVKLATSIDRMVERKALNSFHVTTSNFSSNNIYDLANKLIELSQRKIVLINLKILVESALKKCSLQDAKLLVAKYISRKKSNEICEKLDIPVRTYFRKVNQAECRFEKELSKMGFTPMKLEEYLKDETWIMENKQKFERSNDKEKFEINYKQMERSACALV